MGRAASALAEAMVSRGLSLFEAAALFEHTFISKVLELNGGNCSHAAQVLGIHRNTLRSKMRRNGRPGERS